MGSQVVQALKTVLLVAISAALGQLMAYGASVFDLSAGQWKGIASAGIAAVIAFAYNYLSSWDRRYGIGAITGDDMDRWDIQ